MTSTPIIKIALPGKSINSTNKRDFSFISEYNSIKIFSKGSSSVSVSGSSYSGVSIPHDLGFYPMCMIYVELTPGSGRWYAKPFNYISTENSYVSDNPSYTSANTSNLNFRIINNTVSSKTINYYYYILCHDGK